MQELLKEDAEKHWDHIGQQSLQHHPGVTTAVQYDHFFKALLQGEEQ